MDSCQEVSWLIKLASIPELLRLLGVAVGFWVVSSVGCELEERVGRELVGFPVQELGCGFRGVGRVFLKEHQLRVS